MENNNKICLENVLIQTFFLLQFAANKSLVESEKIALERGIGLKHDMKYNHRLIIESTKRLKQLHERQLELANVLNIENFDALLKDNLYCIRLLLRIWDRAYGDINTFNKVEEFVKSLPKGNLIEDSDIEELFNFKG